MCSQAALANSGSGFRPRMARLKAYAYRTYCFEKAQDVRPKHFLSMSMDWSS